MLPEYDRACPLKLILGVQGGIAGGNDTSEIRLIIREWIEEFNGAVQTTGGLGARILGS